MIEVTHRKGLPGRHDGESVTCETEATGMTNTFAELLRRFRIQASLTQEQLAERAGISADAVAALEQGRRKSPRLSTVSDLASALDLVPSDRSRLAASAKGEANLSEEPSERRPSGTQTSQRRRSFPAPLTPFVGRSVEVNSLLHEVSTERLVTLTGPGGAGKTRLALAVANGALEKFEGGTWWIDLSGVHDSAAVPQAVLGSMGAVENPSRLAADQVLASLPDVPVLLVLDNCEQVIDAVAKLVAKLTTVLSVSIVATSREPIGIPGEIVWPVAGLAIPTDDLIDEAEALAAVPSVELFADRASRADPTFRLVGETARAVVKICQRLEGMPLALELNAARVRSIPMDALAEELDRRIALSNTVARGLPDRQSTLWACIDWSYQLLTDLEQRLFRCLAVSFAPLPIDAITAIAGSLDPSINEYEVSDTVGRLVLKSMVMAPEPPEKIHPTGFRLLESLRSYAWERAQEAGELEEMRDAHADHLVAWLESLETDEPSDSAMQDVAAAYANIRAALTWSIAQGSGRSSDLVFALGGSWHFHSRLQDAKVLGDAVLRVVQEDRLRWARAVGALSLARLLGGDLEFISSAVPESAVVARQHQDRRTEGWARYVRGIVPPFDQGELEAVYEIGSALDRPSLAAVAAVAASIGGIGEPERDWMAQIDELRPRLGTRTMQANCQLATVAALTEDGRFEEALELALPIASDPDVMPTTCDGAYGRIALLAFLQDDLELADLTERIGNSLDERWPTGGRRWSIPAIQLAMVRRLPVPFESIGVWNTRLGLHPSVVRILCWANLDQGRVIDPEAVAQQKTPPAPRSLMGASCAAVKASQVAQSDPQAAVSLWYEVLDLASDQGYRVLACDGLEGLGTILSTQNELKTASVLLEAAGELRREIGYRFRFEFERSALSTALATIDSSTVSRVSPLPWREAIDFAFGR